VSKISKREELAEYILELLYNEEFKKEQYLVNADYINGRKNRAIEHYKYSSVFHSKVNTAVAYIAKITGIREER